MYQHLLTSSTAQLSYMYGKHGTVSPRHLKPETVSDVIVPSAIGYLIAVGPRIIPSLVAVVPELFGGANPLFGPRGAIRTPGIPKFAKTAGSKLSFSTLKKGGSLGVAAAAVYHGVDMTMSPGATVTHGLYGSVSVIPKLGNLSYY